MAIQSFACEETENLFQNGSTSIFNSIQRSAERKLIMLHAASKLHDLKCPPGNRLHPLDRERSGQHSISINDQYRICFVWTDAGPEKVEIVDYH